MAAAAEKLEKGVAPKLSEAQIDAVLEGLMPKRDAMEAAIRGLVESVVTETFKRSVREVTTTINIKGDKLPKKAFDGLFHRDFDEILKSIVCGNLMLVGPAGSGKTTLAKQVADAMDLPFYFNGAINSEYKLTGFINARGMIVSTDFRKAFEEGGVYLFDEFDASHPNATTTFNAALSNNWMDFPDGRVERHENFYCMAACNTYGRGADRLYVGRNQLDAASLDRFMMFDLDYDEGLELALAGDPDWVNYVQRVRKAIFDLKLRHVVSPRASIMGAKLLSVGINRKKVEAMTVWKGIDADSKKNVEGRI
jgi:SpoVK/Ycf46/Vps4 family AAA+-type ATPase